MKNLKVVFILAAITLAATGCIKDPTQSKNVSDYNIRHINAGKLIGNWGVDAYHGQDYPNGLFSKTDPALAKIEFIFYPATSDGIEPQGDGKILNQNFRFPAKDQEVKFHWIFKKDNINVITITVLDANGKEIGGNEAMVDGANFKARIYSAYKTVPVNGQLEKQWYSTSWDLYQLPY